MEVLTLGIKFYKNFFNIDFPFSKYDMVFVPEFVSKAMENVGCVTFNESLLFKNSTSEKLRCKRALTILHELAHMWFGNLVTME